MQFIILKFQNEFDIFLDKNSNNNSDNNNNDNNNLNNVWKIGEEELKDIFISLKLCCSLRTKYYDNNNDSKNIKILLLGNNIDYLFNIISSLSLKIYYFLFNNNVF